LNPVDLAMGGRPIGPHSWFLCMLVGHVFGIRMRTTIERKRQKIKRIELQNIAN